MEFNKVYLISLFAILCTINDVLCKGGRGGGGRSSSGRSSSSHSRGSGSNSRSSSSSSFSHSNINTPSYSRPAHDPPVYTPRVNTPPAYTLLAHAPPAYSPPAHAPPAYSPPAHAPPAYSLPDYAPPAYSPTAHAPPAYNLPSYNFFQTFKPYTYHPPPPYVPHTSVSESNIHTSNGKDYRSFLLHYGLGDVNRNNLFYGRSWSPHRSFNSPDSGELNSHESQTPDDHVNSQNENVDKITPPYYKSPIFDNGNVDLKIPPIFDISSFAKSIEVQQKNYPKENTKEVNCRKIMNSELNENGEIIDSIKEVCDDLPTTSTATDIMPTTTTTTTLRTTITSTPTAATTEETTAAETTASETTASETTASETTTLETATTEVTTPAITTTTTAERFSAIPYTMHKEHHQRLIASATGGINCRWIMDSKLNEQNEIIDIVTEVCEPPPTTTTTTTTTTKPTLKITIKSPTTTTLPLVKVCRRHMNSVLNQQDEIKDSVTEICTFQPATNQF